MKRTGAPMLAMLAGILLFSSIGCGHIQLKNNAVRQAGTVSGIYEQQVLDNLARFAVNPYAIPSFSVASQSTNGVSNQGKVGLSDGAFKKPFFAFLSVSGTRDTDQNFTLDPVTSPVRLQLMQCAYQRAIGLSMDDCSKCCEYLAAWTGKPDACFDSCGITSGWLCTSNLKKDIPKSCCESYGRYCGTFVWVDPCYRNEFSRLVMTIFDYAAGSPASAPDQVEVTYYLASDGSPAVAGSHQKVVKALEPKAATIQRFSLAVDPALQKQVEDKLAAYAKLEQFAKDTTAKISEDQQIAALDAELSKAFSDGEVSATDIKTSRDAASESTLAVPELLQRLQKSIEASKQARDGVERVMNMPIPSTQPRLDFGLPAGSSRLLYGGGVLRQQQLLDTVP